MAHQVEVKLFGNSLIQTDDGQQRGINTEVQNDKETPNESGENRNKSAARNRPEIVVATSKVFH